MDKIRFFIIAALVFSIGLIGSGCPSAVAERNEDAPVEEQTPEDGEKKLYDAPKAVTDVELQAVGGSSFKISDYKGDVVLINLWATWCTPCIEEMPYFNKLHTKFGDDGLTIIGLNADEETDAQVNRFVGEQKLIYKIGWAEAEVVKEFYKISKLPGIPQSLLINREGKMVGMFRGGGPRVISQMVRAIEKEMDAEDSILDEPKEG